MNKAKHYCFNQMVKLKLSRLNCETAFYILNKFEFNKLGVCESKTIAKPVATVATTAIIIAVFY